MWQRLRRWLDWLVLAAIVFWALSLAVDSRRRAAEGNFVGRSLLILASPVIRVSDAIRDSVASVALSLFEGARLQEENRALRNQLMRLELELDTTRDTNARLERLAGGIQAKDLSERFHLVLAEVIGRGRQPNSSVLLISRGERDGLETGAPVTYGSALIGVVRETQRTSAYVQLLTDPNSWVSCTIERTRESGFVRGLGQRGPHLEFLPDVQTFGFPQDAELVTSGLTGLMYPGGLRVGRISRDEIGKSGERVGVVEPAADFRSIEEVVVLTPREDAVPAKGRAPREPSEATTDTATSDALVGVDVMDGVDLEDSVDNVDVGTTPTTASE